MSSSTVSQNKYWPAFDLHMHTLPGITGDGKRENEKSIAGYSFSNFTDSLLDVGISLYAITNHNYIHLDDYILNKYLSRKHGINALLGVELDVDDNENGHYHMVCIFDCDLVQSVELASFINEKSEEALNNHAKIRFDADAIGEIISKYRVVFIPHCPRKNPGIPLESQEDLHKLLMKVKEGFLCVLDEKSDWSLGYIKQAIMDKEFYRYAEDVGAVFFSDNKDWSPGKYKERLKRVTCMNSLPTFKGLLHCLTNPTDRFTFREYVPLHSDYISKIEIINKNGDSLLKDSTLYLQPGYNCIIGRSGSGKSLMIHLLKKYLLDDSNALYGNYDNDGVEINIYDESGNRIEKNAINVAVGTAIFNKLIESLDANDSLSFSRVIRRLNANYNQFENYESYKEAYSLKVSDYFDLREKYKNNLSQMNVSINVFDKNVKDLASFSDLKTLSVEGTPTPSAFELTDSEIEEISNYAEHFEKLTIIAKHYDKISPNNKLNELLGSLRKEFERANLNVKSKKSSLDYKNKKIELINSAIFSINKNVSQNAAKKASLEQYFRDEVEKVANQIVDLLKLRLQIDAYDLSVDLEKMKSNKTIVASGNIVVIEGIEEDDFKQASHKAKKVYNVHGLSISENGIFDLTTKKDSKRFFDVIYSSPKFEFKKETVRQKLFSDITPSLKLLFDGQDVKTLNSGDIAKTYLKEYFENQLGKGNSIVLYDQLENDVDKEFIKNDLLSYISNLKKKIQIIVVTHDPIIAVNGDPVCYVLAEKDNDKRISYRSFVAESEEKDELETLANTVDGSKDVIRERYRVYKGESLW